MTDHELLLMYLKQMKILFKDPLAHRAIKDVLKENYGVDEEKLEEIHQLALDVLQEMIDLNKESVIKEIDFAELKEQFGDKEGIVCLGVSAPEDWIQGITNLWVDDDLVIKQPETDMYDPKVYFSGFYLLATSGGRRDLVFIFKEDMSVDMSKLAMWRLRFGSCSWLSDYFVNYADNY